MTRHTALLRGINVGGKNKLAMTDLARIFVELGASEVETYIQSGNVLYCASDALADSIPSRVTAQLSERFGLSVPVVTRPGEELARIAESNPFLARGVDPRHLHVGFLADPVFGDGGLDPQRSPPDAFELDGGEIYLCCPNGVARTRLTTAYFDRALGTVSTFRNWSTVLTLAKKAVG
jgi:uncharacterized protein (DUF1697 family)